MPLSYVATLWPMLTTVISIDRGEAYPRGVEYPMIDLALDKLINVVGLEQLDPTLFPGRTLPSRDALDKHEPVARRRACHDSIVNAIVYFIGLEVNR